MAGKSKQDRVKFNQDWAVEFTFDAEQRLRSEPLKSILDKLGRREETFAKLSYFRDRAANDLDWTSKRDVASFRQELSGWAAETFGQDALTLEETDALGPTPNALML